MSPLPPLPTVSPYTTLFRSLTAAALRYTDPVTKVTILPRGRALGYTMVMPSEDKYSTTRNELLDQLVRSEGTRLNSSHVAISYAVFCLKKLYLVTMTS